MTPRARAALLAALLLVCRTGAATEPAGEKAVSASTDRVGPIQDNSFLLEEAYNQEPGVIQHISTFSVARGGAWIGSFTEEWPVNGQFHQLSVTVPFARVGGEANRPSGLGDVLLNYRIQAAGSGDSRIAFAPRLSLVTPSGDAARGLGNGGWGLQVNLPLSVELTAKLVTHTNAGATRTLGARGAAGPRDAFNLAQSFTWLAGRRFNPLLEVSWLRFQEAADAASPTWSTQLFVSPGVRWAIDFPSGLQVVPGIAFPVGVGPSRGERSVFFYLSFEHPL